MDNVNETETPAVWRRAAWFEQVYGLTAYALNRLVAAGVVRSRKFDSARSGARYYRVEDVAAAFDAPETPVENADVHA